MAQISCLLLLLLALVSSPITPILAIRVPAQQHRFLAAVKSTRMETSTTRHILAAALDPIHAAHSRFLLDTVDPSGDSVEATDDGFGNEDNEDNAHNKDNEDNEDNADNEDNEDNADNEDNEDTYDSVDFDEISQPQDSTDALAVAPQAAGPIATSPRAEAPSSSSSDPNGNLTTSTNPGKSTAADGSSKSAESTFFQGIGLPVSGCGVPPEFVNDLPFVALNTNSEFSSGSNCGRWVEITLGQNCVGGSNPIDGPPCNGGSVSPSSAC
jgi:hypothetical protein